MASYIYLARPQFAPLSGVQRARYFVANRLQWSGIAARSAPCTASRQTCPKTQIVTAQGIEYRVPVDHPCVQGHFPGNPIIPGAFLLSEIVNAISHHLNLDLSQVEIKAAKFFYPTRLGDKIRIEFNLADEENVKFNCTVDEKKVLAGQVKCKAITKI